MTLLTTLTLPLLLLLWTAAAENIVEVMDFHESLSRSSFTFSETLPQRLCDEIYKCGMDYQLPYDDDAAKEL